ncbi:hypothetical protein Esi_0150_0078 [Ectocarpus siliculosus]|uniref:Uncharacterized protein n=1 Tax=Ectocarpus siliculosus TaxID=2880 RepID=D7FL15_ECTSI|nr:hypothetical protein Esi_0150_0078 [Ectocarpus siliculosus]|eukprot:CBJ29558.1 hypothetical protein Esi_0150_0078 [Ectocarpus siliculosus]
MKIMRLHIAGHILEKDLTGGVCGLCGQDNGCNSWVNTPQTGKAAQRVYSRCPWAPRSAKDEGSIVSITLNSAKKNTKNMPCTNVPMGFIFCNRWEWKFSMSNHVDELHAADAKLRKTDSKGQQFLESIIVGEDEKKAVGAMLQKDLKRVGGGAHKTKVVVRGNTTGKTGAKGKGGKGNRRVDTPSESSDSSSDSSDDSSIEPDSGDGDEEEDVIEDDEQDNEQEDEEEEKE